MREHGMFGARRGKTPRTTTPSSEGRRATDLLERDFTAPAPNRVWVADFERHEAFLNRAVVSGGERTPPLACRSRLVKLRAA
jgi:putative transposase